MTRKQVESKFSMDGGLQSLFSPIRYTHPSCPFFKIDVEYDSPHRPADQHRLGAGKNDKVIRVSKPYIEYPTQD